MTTERGWRGGERQLLLLMHMLRERGAEQALAVPEGSPCSVRARRAGYALVPLHPKVPMHPVNVVRLLGAGSGPSRTILHAHNSPALSLAAIARKIGRFAGVVFTRRTAFPVRPSRKYRSAADLYVAISAAAEGRLINAGTPTDRILSIPDGVDLENLAGEELRPGLKPPGSSHPVVVSVGYLSREKGHRVLIRAWPKVIRNVPDARLLIAGEGPESDALAEQARDLRLQSSVRFLGFVEPIGGLLRSADVFVMPSLEEGLGSATLEAMWMGLPVVASAAGGLSEAVIEGRTGRLVPPGDVESLARIIVEVLEDRQTRLRMGLAGRARAISQYQASTMADRYMEAYQKVLSPSPRHPEIR